MLIASHNQQLPQPTLPIQQVTMATSDLEFLEQANQYLQVHDTHETFDVGILDRVVQIMNQGAGEAQKKAAFILASFKEIDSAWMRADAILEFAANDETKYYGLQILEAMIDTRWKSLPREQAEGIKGFIVTAILKLTTATDAAETDKLYLQKLDLVLVSIVKQEWPRYWPTFIEDIVGSSFSNENVCMNNMVILRLLSEEVFEFGTGMTSARAIHLKEQFCSQFEGVHKLCKKVLEVTSNGDLVLATLRTLHGFLNWIPIGYVFADNLIDLISQKYLPFLRFRSISLQCLVEVSSIPIEQGCHTYDQNLVQMFVNVVEIMQREITDGVNLAAGYANGSTEDQKFLSNLAQFYSTFFKEHLSLVEEPARLKKDMNLRAKLNHALTTLINLTQIEDVEVFKICLDFWNWLCSELYRQYPFAENRFAMFDGLGLRENENDNTRRGFFNSHLSQLRALMIGRMVKPEEVIVVVNENNEAVRELVKDTDSMILYRTMRETLVTLTHLNPRDTETKMTEKLQNQVNGSEWSWKNLNTLCWAIGSISGALTEDDEKRFLVTVIRDLLGLCEQKRGKDNKAVIASNIMYVVGQYPRFLRVHWKFLKTVINKLFEFMHESHEGVQDMACDTFIKIVMKCKNHFVIVQPGESRPFIDEIIENLNSIICDLSQPQVHVFFEAVGFIIASEHSENIQTNLVSRLMQLPNSIWDEIIASAGNDSNIISTPDVVKNISHILKTNVAACKAIGIGFYPQLKRIMSDMLAVYQFISGNINTAIGQHGQEILRQPLIKQMRVVKKEILVLLSTFISRAQDSRQPGTIRVQSEEIVSEVVTPLFGTVLRDYYDNVADAREPKVLSLLAITVTALKEYVYEAVPNMIQAVYESTLEMITKDFESYPEHRTNFFVFVSAIIRYSFKSLFDLEAKYRDFTVEAINWGMRHTMRTVAENATAILRQLLCQIAELDAKSVNKELAQEFYRAYYLKILEHVVTVAADYNQVPFVGLTNMAETLCIVFEAPEDNISVALYQPGEGANNMDYIVNQLMIMLKQCFPHLTESQIRITVDGFFSFNKNLTKMRDHIRDFMIQIRQHNGEDTSDLFLEEKAREIEKAQSEKNAIPGVLNPHAIRDDDEMQ
uniref:Exportin-1 n=1 Tax=Panagrellus redivivus TaxID=6233 RepID=A0A7E4VWL2_PANRE